MLIDLILAGVAALAQGEPAPQQEKKVEVRAPSEQELEAKALELGVKYFKDTKNNAVTSELAIAQYELANLRWTAAEEQLKKENGAYSKALQDKYAAARTAADFALDFTFKSATASTPEIDERIGKSYFIIGSAYLRESDPKKGLGALRKGFSWAGAETKRAIGKEIFSQYNSTGLQHIVMEFNKPALKESLLDITLEYENYLTTQGRTLDITIGAPENTRNASLFYRATALHLLAKEKKKPMEQRTHNAVLEPLFISYTVIHHYLKNDSDKELLVPSFIKEYASVQKEFKELKGLHKDYHAWNADREKSSAGKMKGADELLKEFEKRAKFD